MNSTSVHKPNTIGVRTLLNKQDNALLNITAPSLNKLFKLDKLNKLYESTPQNLDCISFIDQILGQLDIKTLIKDTEFDRIPKSGPVVIVSNHPFGGIDGLILLRLIKQVRPDSKIMANQFLSQLTEISEDCIFVDAFNKCDKKNCSPIKHCLTHLKQDGLLAVFPAGSVSHYHKKDRRVSDDEWNPAIFRMAKITGATVVPVFFKGKNSLFFNMLGAVHSKIRTALLPSELVRQGREIDISIGSPIPPVSIKRFSQDQKGIDFLRLQTLLLGSKTTDSKFNLSHTDQAPIIDAQNNYLLNSEIASLDNNCLLHTYKEFDVFCAKSTQVPYILQEIGRLREITFRRAGEGTGESIDLDDYDKLYEQLFIWNRDKQEIVGAYRIGRVNELLDQHGKNGIYTSLFYKYDNKFLNKYRMGLEMGRSFVRPEYQRKPYSLLLLWRGIGAYMLRNPEYRYLFGAVSVSNEYSPISRAIISETLLSHNESIPPIEKRQLLKLNTEIKRFCKRLNIEKPEHLSALVKNLEEDSKDVPPLIKHYMKMGGSFCSFAVDNDFGGTLDGLIIVDLPKAPTKSLQTYLGDAYQDYCDVHP
jgi:putative hemolysin